MFAQKCPDFCYVYLSFRMPPRLIIVNSVALKLINNITYVIHFIQFSKIWYFEESLPCFSFFFKIYLKIWRLILEKKIRCIIFVNLDNKYWVKAAHAPITTYYEDFNPELFSQFRQNLFPSSASILTVTIRYWP